MKLQVLIVQKLYVLICFVLCGNRMRWILGLFFWSVFSFLFFLVFRVGGGGNRVNRGTEGRMKLSHAV